MATDLREVLGKYVPQAVLEQALEEIKDTDAAPEWFRTEAAKLGSAAKERDELRARLESIEKGPRREALAAKFGVDVTSLKKAERHALEQFDWEGDEPSEEAFAQHLSEWEIPASGKPDQPTISEPNAARIVDQAVNSSSVPLPTNQDAEFHRELDAVPDGDKQAVTAVLEKYGRLAPDHG